MTARHDIRFANRRLARQRAAINAIPAPRLGEMLQLARENKGVDLFRAERDTKIRLRYLAALEDSDFDELPAPVYTKGFLRNYAIYLGLDPEEVLLRWRNEMQAVRTAERQVVAPPPRPIVAPRRGPAITPGLLMAVVLSLAVLGFVGYIGAQLLRFTDAPSVTVTNPRTLVSQVNSESILLTGESAPNAVLTIQGSGGPQYSTRADETGAWTREVPLSRGRNDLRVSAHDPVTGRDSEPVNLIVTVPLPAAEESPAAPATAQPPAPVRLGLASPADGAQLPAGPVTVSGSTSGTRVVIGGEYLGPLGAPPQLSPLPTAEQSPAASADPDTGQPSMPSRDVTVPPTGSFAQQLDLAPGLWRLTITASSAGLQPVVETRTITVEQPDELTLEIEVLRRESWIRVIADGEVVKGYRGRVLQNGEKHTFLAGEEIWLRAGNAGVLKVTLNGEDLGPLGRRGQIGNWIFRLGQEPEQTSERR
jgi:cytoskeletal protein RodZ